MPWPIPGAGRYHDVSHSVRLPLTQGRVVTGSVLSLP